MKKANETKEQGKELKEIFALWKHNGEKGTYLTGKTEDGSINLVGFFNTNKKNPNEPDVRVYEQTDKDQKLENQVCALWENVGKSGAKYLSGTDNENKKVVGFYGNENEEKRPYIRVYNKEN